MTTQSPGSAASNDPNKARLRELNKAIKPLRAKISQLKQELTESRAAIKPLREERASLRTPKK